MGFLNDLIIYFQLNSRSALTCSLALSAVCVKSYPPSSIDPTFPLQYFFA